ncbi:MAG TPA: penicillin-binding protein activator [Symbiobacteriaceae bacterium]|nr:penicillin-binding protein activator [Symbiobacteriaceae bacterium]
MSARKGFVRGIALALSALVLVACGGQQQQTPSAPASSTPAPAAAAAEPKVLKLGVIQPLTGAIAFGAVAAANGHKLAVEEINAKGIKIGNDIYKIELVIEDDKATPKDTAAAAQKLIDRDKVPLIMGSFTSSSTFAAAEVADRAGIPIISPLSSSSKLTNSGLKWFFRGRVTTDNNVAAAAKFFSTGLGYKKIAMLAINDDWGRGDTTAFPAEWAKLGVEVTATEYFNNGDTNFYPLLRKIAGTSPDALFVTASTEPAAMIFKQAREVAPNLPLLTSGGIDPAQTIKLAGAEPLEGIYFWSVDGPSNDTHKAFEKKYKDKFGQDAISNSKSAYDVTYIVAQAFERAGTTDPDKLREAMLKTQYKGLMGDYNFDERGESFLKMNYGLFKNGTFEILPKQ